jgi:hypothetical protein
LLGIGYEKFVSVTRNITLSAPEIPAGTEARHIVTKICAKQGSGQLPVHRANRAIPFPLRTFLGYP